MSESDQRAVNRSPEHPSMDLASAIERAEALYEAEGFNWTSAEVATSHWGYAAKSGSGYRTIAALKHFGLVEDTGTGKERKVRLADLARRIIRDKREGSVERVHAIRQAALNPSIYKKLWERWGAQGRLPSSTTMEYELEHEWAFNPRAIGSFIRDFIATIEFAGLLNNVRGPEDTPETSTDSSKNEQEPPTKPSSQRRPVADNKMLEMPIPLASGDRAFLSIPVPLTPDDYDLLVEMISTTLRLMRRAIVTDADRPRASDRAVELPDQGSTGA